MNSSLDNTSSDNSSKSKLPRVDRGPEDFSKLVQNKLQTYTRTGQACDRCKVRILIFLYMSTTILTKETLEAPNVAISRITLKEDFRWPVVETLKLCLLLTVLEWIERSK